MHADIFSLPDIGVDIFGAFSDIDSVVDELTQEPTSDDSPEVAEALRHNRCLLNTLCGLYLSRPYLDKIDYCERLINYLVAYACKGEISATDAASMFRNLANSDLADDTPVASLARKLSLRVLKARECPRPEIALSLQGLQMYRSSIQVRFSLNSVFFHFFFSHPTPP